MQNRINMYVQRKLSGQKYMVAQLKWYGVTKILMNKKRNPRSEIGKRIGANAAYFELD